MKQGSLVEGETGPELNLLTYTMCSQTELFRLKSVKIWLNLLLLHSVCGVLCTHIEVT